MKTPPQNNEEDEEQICPTCLKIVTSKDIETDLSMGGTGMCMCQWTSDNRVYYPYEDFKTCRTTLVSNIENLKNKLKKLDEIVREEARKR